MTSSDPSSTQLHNGDHEEGLETRRSQQHKGLQQIDTTSHEVAPGKARSPDKSQSQEDSTLAPQLEQTLLWNSVNVTRPAGKLHIRLGEEEMLDCFRHTSVAQIRKDEYDLSPTVINTTQFYRELYAAEGSVTGEINLNQTELRVRSEHLNESIECSVGSSSFYTKYCCVIRVRVPIGFHVVAEVMESSVSTTRLYDDKYHEAIGGEIFDHEDDEDFCGFAPCLIGEYSCDNGQCVPKEKKCDGWEDCYNGNDESYCYVYKTPHQPIPPPALVTLSDGGFVVRPLDISPATDPSRVCPGTHFLCPHDGYCLPLLFRCNGLYDCPGREDEADCDGYTCPGFYRCRATSVCLPPSQLCDGRAHCPQHDDELMCDLTCPLPCQCRGLAFFCQDVFTASAHPHLRFLDASGSSMTPELLSNNLMLIHLSLADCNLTVLDVLSFPNLLILDISYNRVSSTRSLRLSGVPLLRELSLAGNPLVHVFEDDGELSPYSSVWKLDLSRVALHVLNASIVSTFPNLRILNLSHSMVERAPQEGFRAMRHLRVIDLRGCPMTWFPPDLFRSLSELRTVYAHSFKMCCPVLLPADFNVRNCLAPSDEISSCEDLLQSGGYRMFVFLLSILAVLGNAVSFVFRTVMSKRKTKLGYGNFVTHLSVSDFVMGVYLAIIGVADRVYQGAYLWNEVTWKHSVPCQLAGFLSLLSSEVSALIMCLITLDRFLVLRFPFSRLHFSPRSAHAASAVAWLCGVLLAAIPLLPATAHWHFYSQTGICIPLPITRSEFAGHGYSFSIFIVLNFVLFFFICAGQVSIYWSIRTNSMSASNSTKAVKDLTIARRLITVAMSDFLCWFPIGLLGLLASSGVAIPGEVNVAVAIFVLPLNSTINPCLYTLNVIMERRRLAREDKLRKMLLSQLNAHF
ncbi:G-protein coupled receptor GRL101-like [Littorina saxatilis]|uniref:G-protein coupled receptor GRL101-like n=1 Tax=Littorina saxatilis TaxID=31220 RepID=UPI0038B5F9FB